MRRLNLHIVAAYDAMAGLDAIAYDGCGTILPPECWCQRKALAFAGRCPVVPLSGPEIAPGGALLYSGVRVEIGKGVGIMILTFLEKQAKIK